MFMNVSLAEDGFPSPLRMPPKALHQQRLSRTRREPRALGRRPMHAAHIFQSLSWGSASQASPCWKHEFVISDQFGVGFDIRETAIVVYHRGPDNVQACSGEHIIHPSVSHMRNPRYTLPLCLTVNTTRVFWSLGSGPLKLVRRY